MRDLKIANLKSFSSLEFGPGQNGERIFQIKYSRISIAYLELNYSLREIAKIVNFTTRRLKRETSNKSIGSGACYSEKRYSSDNYITDNYMSVLWEN